LEEIGSSGIGIIGVPYMRSNGKEFHLLCFQDITNGHLLFVMGALILQRAQKCEVRQVTKDVVKSEV